MAAPSSAAFVAPRSSFSIIRNGGYSLRQLRHTAFAMQYNSNASSSHEEEEQDKGNTIIDSRQKVRRKHRQTLPLQREAMEFTGGGISSSSITKHTINDELCPPTNTNILQQLVQKHITTLPKYISSKPIAKHNIEAFNEVLNYITCYNLKQRQKQQQQSTTTHSEDTSSCNSTTSRVKTKIILDSGCGTGRSSYILGEQYKDCIIVGIDQSLVRLSRNKAYRESNNNNLHTTMDREEEEEVVVVADITEKLPNNSSSSSSSSSNSNVILVRAELSDFWYLCTSSPQFQQQASIIQHYILYPNPYPKKSRLQHRFYAHPSFPLLMMTLDSMDDDNDNDNNNDKVLIVRSNWKGYLDEFKVATNIWSENIIIDNNREVNENCVQGIVNNIAWEMRGPEQLPCTISPMTNFEAKFLDCGEPIYELTIRKRRVKVGHPIE
jgi:tRNA G46 methylase TrmB